MTTDTPTDLSALSAALPGIDLIAAPPAYLEEPRGRFHGRAMALARPRGTAEVARIVTHAAATGLPLIPYGGGTGLVSGQVAPEGRPPLLVSLERMTAIREIHAEEALMTVEAGAILQSVQEAAEGAGMLFPLSLASQGTARIGGLLACNAGGVNVLRYGNARDLCLGIEAVLPDGSVFNGLKRLYKDNTGYDLRNLLIGAEGTLGIITAATLKLVPRPAALATAIFVVPDPAAALHLLGLARARMAGQLSAFELISGQGLDFLAEALPDLRRPFVDAPGWMVLVELGLVAGIDGNAALESLFEAGAGEGWVTDGVIAASQAQRQDFWSVREHIPEANRRIGSVSSHDIAVPVSRIPDFIAEGAALVAGLGDGSMRLNCFGHMGDGNLHYNVFPGAGRARSDYDDLRGTVKRAIHDLVHAYGGSVSAEHGIGRLKVEDLERYGDPAKLAAMRAIKAALDPAGIMNPGAVLRQG
ncbi:FAD-binding oxidoreductase [Mangrovicoccus algicola]|uniref:FAD-binding oxidoreductase n=1 Tax=Mangrovicoccus algicola TaxID=2771008 RepID=A0A8J6YXU1_9RHOB|nr:FAD-binding oxidoreductase [Mangrovicoccus algicola]MBE3637778.1 FAD-binding oxidoreductase [Mangrovicoccus algicola]